MKKYLLKNSLVVGIIILFICSSFASNISGFSKDTHEVNIDYEDSYESQEKVVVSCQAYGVSGKSLKQIEMPKPEAEKLLGKINDIAEIIANDPLSDKLELLQGEIISLAKTYELLPIDISFADFQPRFVNSLNTKIPKKEVTPVTGNRGTASICNFATTGEGAQFPIIILPRLIPILLTPIPRAFLHWSANEGLTTCGSYLTGTGFIASGMQRGTALGFWGIGFSVFLPPVMAYGFIGYALFATCTAEEIEPWPPNYAPEVTAVSPVNGAKNIAISTSELSFQISDENGDKMDYTVTTDPDIGSGSGNNKPGGTYSIPISGLEGTEEYTWYVEVSDGQKTVDASFSFETEQVAPIVTDPIPKNNERYISVDLPQLSFRLRDPQGDLMDYTVETSPDIGSGSGTNVGEGIYSIDVSGLDYSSEYKWFVNVTDGKNWKHKDFSFQVEPRMVFDPFDEGWQYRKKITIDHTKVDAGLINFPVLISTIDSDLRDKAQDNGDDILFMNDTDVGTRLYHEIEKYDGSSGELVTWVNVTDLASNQDTILYMYYGNPSSSNQQYPDMVWDTNFLTVQHLNEPFGNIIDSTFNGEDGSKNGNPTYLHQGKIGYCIYFDPSTNDYFSFSDVSFRIPTGMIEMWFDVVAGGSYFGGKDEYGGWNNDLKLFLSSNSTLKMRFDSDGEYIDLMSNDVAGSGWNHVVFQWGNQGMKMFVNGNLQENTNPFTEGINAPGQVFKLGRYHSEREWHGTIDEFRVTTTIRDASWVKTSYDNQNDTEGFLSFGPEET